MYKFFLFNLLYLILFISGCNEDSLEPEILEAPSDVSQLEEGISAEKKSFKNSRFSFTGRDSIGVAFKAKVAGTFTDFSEDELWEGNGNGKATHLAHIRVERSHWVTGDLIENGEVTYFGFKGDALYGTYEGFVQSNSDGSFAFEVVEEITRGTGRFEEVVGKLTTTGTMQLDGTFSYTSDGWLLNTHANKPSE